MQWSASAPPAERRSPAASAPLLAVVLAWTLALHGPPARAAEIAVQDASIEVVNDMYAVAAGVEYRFSPEVLGALDSGIRLTVRVEVEIRQSRRFVWDPVVARVVRSYRLQRHELAKQYVVEDTTTGQRRNFPTLDAAIEALGHGTPVPVVDHSRLEPGTAYYARVRASLDIDALPAPLRPVAFLSPSWRLASDWLERDIAP